MLFLVDSSGVLISLPTQHRNLKELYLTGHQCANAHGPDMATLWPSAQHLRVLVLDVLQDIDHMVSTAFAYALSGNIRGYQAQTLACAMQI